MSVGFFFDFFFNGTVFYSNADVLSELWGSLVEAVFNIYNGYPYSYIQGDTNSLSYGSFNGGVENSNPVGRRC